MNRPARKHGIALMMVLLFLSIFTLATGMIGADTHDLLHSNFGNQLQKRANYCSYAALQQCLAEMDKVTAYNTTTHIYTTAWDPGTNITDLAMIDDPDCKYTVRVDNNSQGTLGNPYTNPDGTVVPVGLVYIKASAVCSPSAGTVGRSYRNSVASLGFVGSVVWQHAVLGTNQVTVTNSIVDSYWANTTAVYPAGNTSTATIGTNGIKNSLLLYGNTTVKGRVRWGPGGTEAVAMHTDPPVNIVGSKLPNASLFRVPRFKPPYNPVNATTDVILAPGETRHLAPGAYRSAFVPAGAHLILDTRNYNDGLGQTATQYFFNDAVNVTGGSIELSSLDAPIASSRVEVYVGESVFVTAGGRINQRGSNGNAPIDDRPGRFELIFVGNGSPRSPQSMIVDASRVESFICGPGLDFQVVNGSHMFGGCRAFNATVANSQVHYDRAIFSDDRIRGQVAWTLKGLVQEGYEGEVEILDIIYTGS